MIYDFFREKGFQLKFVNVNPSKILMAIVIGNNDPKLAPKINSPSHKKRKPFALDFNYDTLHNSFYGKSSVA